MQNNYPSSRGSPAWHTEAIRLTKLGENPDAGWRHLGRLAAGAGYFLEGWFLELPCVGRRMAVLRINRNGILRLGLFTSSEVTLVGEHEIRTVNSVYQLDLVTTNET